MDTKEAELYIYLLAISTAIFFIFVLYFLSILKYQKRLVKLYKEKISVEINTLERERNRFSKDLHDELGPQLSSIKWHIEFMELQKFENIEIRKKLLILIDNMLGHMRAISKNHNPEIIIHDGLENAIVKMRHDVESTTSIKIKFDIQSQQLEKLLLPEKVHVYRIIYEAVNNAVKHAHCTLLNISIDDCLKGIQFKIEDNGSGFDFENELDEPTGLGISNIKSRVNIMSGEFNIYSEPKQGTLILFTIPIYDEIKN